MRFRAIAAALAAVLLFSGCASKICQTAEDAVVTRVSDILVDKLACKNSFAVQQSVSAKVESIAACTKMKGTGQDITDEQAITGPIANLACPIVASWVAGYVATKLPAEWQCEIDPTKIPLTDLVLSGCEFLPLKPAPKGGAK